MSIPDYQTIMLPLLTITGDGQDHSISDLIQRLSSHFQLSDAELSEMLPSGSEAIFRNRVRWARFYLLHALLIEDPKRGIVRITDRGRKVLASNPKTINVKFLNQFSEFVSFKGHKKDGQTEQAEETAETPEELIETGYQKLRTEVESELLARVKGASPKFFEHLVVELMVRLGYGGSIKNPGTVIGKSGDEGVDGVIKEDKLGLELLYIQAKRWDKQVVTRDEVQKFVGALHGKKARKGVFITTSVFAKSAVEYVSTIENKVVLIDGRLLASLMFDTNLGLARVMSREIKKIDSDFFAEDEPPVQAGATTVT